MIFLGIITFIYFLYYLKTPYLVIEQDQLILFSPFKRRKCINKSDLSKAKIKTYYRKSYRHINLYLYVFEKKFAVAKIKLDRLDEITQNLILSEVDNVLEKNKIQW